MFCVYVCGHVWGFHPTSDWVGRKITKCTKSRTFRVVSVCMSLDNFGGQKHINATRERVVGCI